ncbi:MAG: ferritin-like protein [Rhodospirillales bacterium]|nr:ferritin-like protein [Rhodospirillales bacterium]
MTMPTSGICGGTLMFMKALCPAEIVPKRARDYSGTARAKQAPDRSADVRAPCFTPPAPLTIAEAKYFWSKKARICGTSRPLICWKKLVERGDEMLRLQRQRLESMGDAAAALQTAIDLEFSTIPAYLYTKFSIKPGSNRQAVDSLSSIVGQEMTHMCLACNILNAIGGTPKLSSPVYPGPLPGGIGRDGAPLIAHLLPFSPEAMKQGMDIEEPEEPIPFPVERLMMAEAALTVTIGEFYAALDAFLAQLPNTQWAPNRNQIDDAQFFAGQLFPINSYADAHRAISIIVSEGEGTKANPLDFENEVSHYYRFGEVFYDKVLTKADNRLGYTWGPAPLGVDWSAVYPAISDPGTHDFSNEPPTARAVQAACNQAYTTLIEELQRAVSGERARLGNAVRAMFDLRMASTTALSTPLSQSDKVAGPAFIYTPSSTGAVQ